MGSLVIICSCLLAIASATQFQDCGSTATNVKLDFPGCDAPPCFVTRGNSYGATITFTGSASSTTVTNDISAIIAGVKTPWPGIDVNGCNELEAGGTPCPVTAGGDFVWVMDFDILSDYPKLSPVATIALNNTDGGLITCMQVPMVFDLSPKLFQIIQKDVLQFVYTNCRTTTVKIS